MTKETLYNFISETGRKTKGFINSVFFPITIAVFAYLFWYLDWGIYGLTILLAAGGVIFALCCDVTPVINIMFLCVQTLNKTFYNGAALYCYIFAVCCLLIGMTAHVIRFRPFNGYRLKGFTAACLFFSVAIASSGAAVKGRNGLALAAMIGLSVVFLLFSLILSASVGKSALADPVKTVCRVLIVGAVLAAVQLFTVLIKSGAIADVIANKLTLEGYANLNHYANLFARAIPVLIFYSCGKHKLSFINLLFAALFGGLIVICSARATILMAAVVSVPCLVYGGLKAENKKSWLITLGALIVIVAVFIGVFHEKIKELLGELFRRGLNDSGRFEIWRFGWDNFKSHPVFGVGFDSDLGHSPGNDSSIAPYWYHNTLVQTIASMGIVGAIAFVFYIFWQYKTLLLFRKEKRVLAVGASLFLIQLISLLDIHFYVPQDFIQMMAMTMAVVSLLPEDKCNSVILAFPFRFVKYARGSKGSNN